MAEMCIIGSWCLVFDPLVRVPDAGAPDIGGVVDLALVIEDRDIDRLGRLALEDDHVPAGELQFGTEVAAGVRAGDRVRQRTLGDDRVAPAGGGGGARERTGRHDHLIVGPQRIHLGIHLLDEVLGRQSALAQVLFSPLHVEGLALDGPVGEVHPQDFPCPTHWSLPLAVRAVSGRVIRSFRSKLRGARPVAFDRRAKLSAWRQAPWRPVPTASPGRPGRPKPSSCRSRSARCPGR